MTKTQCNSSLFYSSDVCLHLHDAEYLEIQKKSIFIIICLTSTLLREKLSIFVYRINNTIGILNIICNFLSS